MEPEVSIGTKDVVSVATLHQYNHFPLHDAHVQHYEGSGLNFERQSDLDYSKCMQMFFKQSLMDTAMCQKSSFQ